MAEPTLSEKLRTGNLFAEQCPSRACHQPLGRVDSGGAARGNPPFQRSAP